MIGRYALVLVAAGLVFAGVGAAVSLPVYTQGDWADGVYTNTTAVDGVLQLSGGEIRGTYQSGVLDAGDAYTWDNVVVSSAVNGGSVNVTAAVSNDSFSSVVAQKTFQLNGGKERFNISSFPEERYIRFNYSMTGSTSPSITSTNLTLGKGTHFIIRHRSCQSTEKELFSLSNVTNAHAANPGYYSYHVCASGTNQSTYDSVCVGGETPTLSFFGKNENYTHLSVDSNYFDYKLCTGKLSIGIRDSCPPTTKAIVSIYQLPESHIAKPGWYGHQLCGAVFKDVSLMMQFHLGKNDTVYMNGTKNPVEGTYTTPSGWKSSYISAQNDSMVSGIISGEHTRTTSIGYGETGGNHVFNVTQKRGTVSFYLPFTVGDRYTIENRLPLIKQGDFLDQFNPNFGLHLVENALVQLTLQFTNVDLVTNMVLSSGIHNLVITNVGTNAQGEPKVAVNVTAR